MKTQHGWFGVQETAELLQLRIIDFLELKGTLKGHRVHRALVLTGEPKTDRFDYEYHPEQPRCCLNSGRLGAMTRGKGNPWGACPSHQPPSQWRTFLQCPVWTCPDVALFHSLPPAAGYQREEISTSLPLLPLRKVQRERKTCLTWVSGNP